MTRTTNTKAKDGNIRRENEEVNGMMSIEPTTMFKAVGAIMILCIIAGVGYAFAQMIN